MNAQQKISEYDQQAIDFLEATGTKLEIVYTHTDKHFIGDTEKRDIYHFALTNNKGSYSAKFGDSIHNTNRRMLCKDYSGTKSLMPADIRLAKECGFKVDGRGRIGHKQAYAAKQYKPSAYDILSCLDPYAPGTFEEFCSEFGYDDLPLHKHDEIMQIFLDVRAQSKGLRAIFTPEQLDQLAEIN